MYQNLPFKKYISALLVCILLVSQTFRIDFFDDAKAKAEDYRDIVSLIVDTDTYVQQRQKIFRYAEDIQSYLGSTRTAIVVVDKNTTPAQIAAKNEEFYYEGDGERGQSNLVGTVLIGNIPIPMVYTQGQGFPSVYPYVDFENKTFVYNPNSGRYEKSASFRNGIDAPEIWHGVMNPAVGRVWEGASDIEKIGNFLDKTHDFYTESGRFVPSKIPPRVFYYDGFSESLSIDARSIFQHDLFMQNAENLAYNRFNKHLLSDINDRINEFDSRENKDYNEAIESLGIPPSTTTGLDPEGIQDIPDAQTIPIIQSFLKPFVEIFNKKTLGEELLAIHNAGRYNQSGSIRADIPSVITTFQDEMSSSVIKSTNEALEKSIDNAIREQKIIRKIPIFDSGDAKYGKEKRHFYTNYFFGAQGATIRSPERCTIARGDSFGSGVLVESNVAFDISSASGQAQALLPDANRGENCFPGNNVATYAYWGNNSILKLVEGRENDKNPFRHFPENSTFRGFLKPIFSLGGMKESSRISIASPLACLSTEYQYILENKQYTCRTIPRIFDYVDTQVIPKPSKTPFPGGFFPGGNKKPIADNEEYSAYPKVYILTEMSRFNFQPCLAGKLTLDTKVIASANRPCKSALSKEAPVEDRTIYRNMHYHTIDSMIHHTSPTDEEIEAAQKNGVTPSLPIDIIRSVEFLTPKGNIAKIAYPNLFQTSAKTLPEVREWLKNESQKQWQQILEQEAKKQISEGERAFAKTYLGVESETIEPIDWNTFISDELIEKVLQTKHWQKQGIVTRYMQTIESALSYSHIAPGQDKTQSPPDLPGMKDREYEIAYLGLTPLIPEGVSDDAFSQLQNEYQQKLQELFAFNFSQEKQHTSSDGSKDQGDKCGPPEGVDLFKWPAAIKCWIASQLPPKILAGSCGGKSLGKKDKDTDKNNTENTDNTEGGGGSNNNEDEGGTNNNEGDGGGSNTTGVDTEVIDAAGSLTGDQQKELFARSHVTLGASRGYITHNESTSITTRLHTENGDTIIPPLDTKAEFIVENVTAGGVSIAPEKYHEYFSLSAQTIPVGNQQQGSFLLSAKVRDGVIKGKSVYHIPLLDGGTYTLTSEPLTLRIGSEYLRILLEQDGKTSPFISADSELSPVFSVERLSLSQTSTGEKEPAFSVTIFDEISGEEVVPTFQGANGKVAVPASIIKNIGNYRVRVVAQDGVSGEWTFSVQSGAFSVVNLTPISSTILQGASTAVTLSLEDAHGHLIAPNLHAVDLTIQGGKIIDSVGNLLDTMHIDLMEPSFSFGVQANTNVNEVRIGVTVDNEKKWQTEKKIRVIKEAKVNLQFETADEIHVDSEPTSARIQILTPENKQMLGFSSVASWSLSPGAGIFEKDVFSLQNGASEKVTYTPGTRAGKHLLTLDIPGIGNISDIEIKVLPGKPMYIDHSLQDEMILFTVRDRYGNTTDYNGIGTLLVNGEEEKEIQFQNGSYSLPKKNGMYIVRLPELENNTLSYTDASGEQTIKGMPVYAAQIVTDTKLFNFYPDYNARYTVLAGGSFLREGEDILFHSDPHDSQSLAVSTLLDTPYEKDSFVSVFPGGRYTLGQSQDVQVESSITLERGAPIVTLMETLTNREVARIRYPFQDAKFQICAAAHWCDQSQQKNIIQIGLLEENTQFSLKEQAGGVRLYIGNTPILALSSDGKIEKNPAIELVSDISTQDAGFSFFIEVQGRNIARVHMLGDPDASVILTQDIFSPSETNTPILQVAGFHTSTFSENFLNQEAQGYQIHTNANAAYFSEEKNNPSDIKSIGLLSENPGVGWGGENRMLLSYAAGDTVGEATKWFQTYTLINLGDPIAHVTQGLPGTQLDGVDRTVGTQIADSRRSYIKDFFHKDMNADGVEDILVQYMDGYIELFLNLNGKFRSRGNIAYIPDLSDKTLAFGDFQGDGFSDIVGVNHSGSLILINNSDRRLSQMTLQTDDNTPPTHIQQMKIYDMDADGKDDIVYITSYGELGILYGTNTPGLFEKKILDSTLGISFKEESLQTGGAFYGSNIKQFPFPVRDKAIKETELTDAMIQGEVYYQETQEKRRNDQSGTLSPAELAQINTGAFPEYQEQEKSPLDVTSSDKDETPPVTLKTFIRSQYASIANLDIQKKYKNTSSQNTLSSYDMIEATVTLRNTSDTPIENAEYLDTLHTMFSPDEDAFYSVEIEGKAPETHPMESLVTGDYDSRFILGTIPANTTVTIRYQLQAKEFQYGELLVGDFKNGINKYGDVAFRVSETCGDEALKWLATDVRSYKKQFGGLNDTKPGMVLPKGIAEQLVDKDQNGIPDKIENMSLAEREKSYQEIAQSSAQKYETMFNVEKDGDMNFTLTFDIKGADKIESKAQDIFNGLACGFGGGSCMSFPINWAPLAPGNDPVIFGYPVGDGFKVKEGVPIFSAITGLPVYGSHGCFTVPAVWPPTPIGFEDSCKTNRTQAGGYLGVDSPANFIRIFVTPTLTLGMGTAICMGGPAGVIGGNPGKGLFPLIQGGNCIVMAKAMPICKGDGSKDDGDISGLSDLGNGTDTWNADSCTFEESPGSQRKEEQEIREKVIEYMKDPQKKNIAGISAELSNRQINSLDSGPIIQMNGGQGGTSIEISLEGKDKIADIGKVINVKNKRIAGFPDFIMKWLSNQTEELTTSLFSPPNLTIIPPTDFGQNAKVDGSYTNFLSEMSQAFSQQNFENARSQGLSSQKSLTPLPITGQTGPGKQYADALNAGGGKAKELIKTVAGTTQTLKTAYSFIGKLPFIKLNRSRVNINVPWISPGEIDTYIRTLESYKITAENALDNWCVSDPSPSCLASKAKFKDSPLMGSIGQNISRLQEYKNFPEKLQKYVTWKQRYLAQILCNIEAIEKMTFGWVRDNGIRFQKWAELFVLIKAIAESWQPVLDIFAKTSAQCGVCRNERYNAQEWKFKLISAIIPNIPIIKFPKWPDIILDLSDVRLGIDITLPEFNFRLTPLRLPRLPDFSLPNSPNLFVNFPKIPVLPPLPDLPDLPDIPSIPTLKLPNLPPPPKIPKLGGSIQAVLKIMKLISKLYCFYQKTMLVPEWQAGDVIAQRTERQSTLPMDFLNINLPQYSLPTIREIRLNTHINAEIRSDFISEFAKNAVKPINRFSTDLQSAIPGQIGENIDVPGVPSKTIDIPGPKASIGEKITAFIQTLEQDTELLDTDDFLTFFTQELEQTSFGKSLLPSIRKKIQDTHTMQEKTTQELLTYSREKFGGLRHILNKEEESIAHMQSIIQMLKKEDTPDLLAQLPVSSDLPRDGLLASKESDTDSALTRFHIFQEKALETARGDTVGKVGNDIALGGELDKKVRKMNRDAGGALRDTRIAANGETLRENISPELLNTLQEQKSNAKGYKPNFQGIYILSDPSKQQTKLFDYTELVNKSTRVDAVDIDNDGDKDYIFVLGGILYVKKNHTNEPTKIHDTSKPKIISLTSKAEAPSVPNYFEQPLMSTQRLNISFQNAHPGEKEWRMEFFDRYTEWDRVAIGNHRDETAPKTTTDLLIPESFGEFEGGLRSKKVTRSLAAGYNKEGFKLRSPKISVFNAGAHLSFSPNRLFYTGNNSVKIEYKNLDTQLEARYLILEPNRGYQFANTTDLILKDGPLFIINEGLANELYSAREDFGGLPLLFGMEVTSQQAFIIRDHTHSENLRIAPEGQYIIKSLGQEAETYNFHIVYPDGYYYARLLNLSEKVRDRAGVILLAPQSGKDTTEPVLDLSDTIRLPVYTTKTFAYDDIISSLSHYSVRMVSEKSGENLQNTEESSSGTSAPGVTLTEKEIHFGPFDAPGKYSVVLEVTDDNKNSTQMPVNIEVYTPIPYIQNITPETIVSGRLNESIEKEPVHLWRIRAGEFPHLIQTGALWTKEDGEFVSDILSKEPEKIIVSSSGKTWNISECGAFENLPEGLNQFVLPADTSRPMILGVKNSENVSVYEQFFVTPDNTDLIDMSKNPETNTGVLITPQSTVVVTATYNDRFIPGGRYITDIQKKPLLALARDGNIFTFEKDIRFVLSQKEGCIQIQTFKNEEPLAEFVYRIPFFYTKK